MNAYQVAGLATESDRGLAAVRLRLAGVPAQNLAAADVVLHVGVREAVKFLAEGLPAMAAAVMRNAGLQAERLTAIPGSQAEVAALTIVITCQPCKIQRHANCDRIAMDEASETVTDCGCMECAADRAERDS